jgi:hypothetical protein
MTSLSGRTDELAPASFEAASCFVLDSVSHRIITRYAAPGVTAGQAVVVLRDNHVPRAPAADMENGGKSPLAPQGQFKFLVETENGTLTAGVNIARSPPARLERAARMRVEIG